MNVMSDKHIWLFDTTLRDGGQTRGVDFSVSDKIAISQALDEFGIDYVEAGWPGANPTDDQFFEKPPILKKSSFNLIIFFIEFKNFIGCAVSKKTPTSFLYKFLFKPTNPTAP